MRKRPADLVVSHFEKKPAPRCPPPVAGEEEKEITGIIFYDK